MEQTLPVTGNVLPAVFCRRVLLIYRLCLLRYTASFITYLIRDGNGTDTACGVKPCRLIQRILRHEEKYVLR